MVDQTVNHLLQFDNPLFDVFCFLLGNIAQLKCNDDLRIHLCRRTERCVQKLTKLAGVLSRLPFGDVGGDGYR